ncbi:MAG: hypothetical protein EOP09_03520 [Proteobacteria bacterium]|nr:MAG: hypothetical protein EOP09_03520 [Pseudomonadota bacterium]
MKILCFAILLSIAAGCSSIEKRNTPLSFVDPEKIEVEAIEDKLEKAQFQEVVTLVDIYQNKYPYSLKLQRVRFLKAGALEELERFSEAAETYRTISQFSERNQPEISAMSVYRLSFVYEALGDDQRVLTSLLEALKNRTYLPNEVSEAEIPSRIAMVYSKENNPAEAAKWLAKADEGLKKVLDTQREPLTNTWLAKTYFNMGSLSTSQLSTENILTIIQGQAAVQKYLIRSLQYGDPMWSAKALRRLQTTYTDLWNAINNYPEQTGIEPLAAKKAKKEQQIVLAGPLFNLIEDAMLYQPGPEQKQNQYQVNFFNFLDQIQTRIGGLLQESLYTPLTSGRDNTPQKPRNPVKIVPSTDPNL